ncbi:MAG: hypothetical protein ACM3S0_19380 [Acidobacteriota bacterium]
MRGIWNSYGIYRPRSASWLASILFFLTGVLIVLLVPPIIQIGPDHDAQVLWVHVIAGIFAGLGIFYLIGWMGDWYFERYYSFYRPVWTFWYTYIGGLFAAALFAIPLALAFPVLLSTYFLRPNVYFAADSILSVNSTMAALLISAIGISCVVYRLFWAVDKYRARPIVRIVQTE